MPHKHTGNNTTVSLKMKQGGLVFEQYDTSLILDKTCTTNIKETTQQTVTVDVFQINTFNLFQIPHEPMNCLCLTEE